ncbi:MAG: hypothetical protein LBP72_01330, partial [Dysgonamonadaceae bacterium]|nr:hypothetical protein [Dysgonamonadaceae bacterium]
QSGNKDYEAAPDSTVTLTVSGGAGLSEVSSSLPVRFESGRLTVVAPIDTPIEVYTVVGVKLQSRRSTGGETVIDRLPKQGALIVRIGKTVTKVIR